MQTYSKQELKERAEKVMQELDVDQVVATTDGQMFLHENRAELHAKSFDKKLKTYVFDNENNLSDEGQADDEDYTVNQIEEMLPEVTDLAQLAVMLEDEQNGKKRTTAIKAIEERASELKEDNREDQ